MKKLLTASGVAVSGVLVAKAGQGVMAIEYDWFWATLAVVSILSAATILLSEQISRALAPVTARRR